MLIEQRANLRKYTSLIIALMVLSTLTSSNAIPTKERVRFSGPLEIHFDKQSNPYLSTEPYLTPESYQDLGEITWDEGFDIVWYEANKSRWKLFLLWESEQGHIENIVFNVASPFTIDFQNEVWVRKLRSVGDESLIVFIEKQVLLLYETGENDKYPQVSSCPNAPTQQLTIGEQAYVCTLEDLLLVHSNPYKQSPVITKLAPGTLSIIVQGPVCADDWSWWQIRTDKGMVGWVAEGGDEIDPYFICPNTEDRQPTPSNTCPGAPLERLEIGETAHICTRIDPLLIREKPGLGTQGIFWIYPGRFFTVVKGPVCADGYNWWRIRTKDNVVGWVAEGGDVLDPYYVCPGRPE